MQQLQLKTEVNFTVTVRRKMHTKTFGSAEDNFITLLNFIADPAIIVDEKGHFIVVNDAFTDLTGLTKKELIGTAFIDLNLLTAKTKSFLFENLKKRLNGTNIEPYEFSFKNRAGATRYAEVKAKRVKYSGHPADLVVFHDITRRKENTRRLKEYSEKMEALVNEKVKEIKESEEKYKELTESISDVFFAMDKDLRYTYWNKASEKLIGIPSKEAIGKSITEVFPDVSGTEIEQFYRKVLRTKQPKTFLNNFKLGDTEFVFEVSAYPTIAGLSVFVKDITDCKKIEEKLRASEKHFRETLDNMIEGCQIVGYDWRYLYVNDVAAQHGRATKEKLLGKTMMEVYPGIEKTEMFSKLGECMQNRTPILMENEFQFPDGGKGWFELRVQPVPEGIFILSMDISERKRTEEALRLSEAKYRKLINGMNDTAWVIGLNGKFIDVNDAAVKVLGYSREELLNMGPQDIDDNLTREQILHLIRSMPADQTQVFETAHTTKGGKKIPVEISSSLVIYQGKQAILSIARDISERNKSEEALKESEEKFRNVSEESPNMIFINKEGTIVYANKKCENVMGYTKEEFRAPHFSFLTLIAPESSGKIHANYRRHMAGEEVEPYEYTLVTKAGKKISAVITTKLIKYDGERAILGIVTDITERKQLENALRESEEMFRAISTSAMDAIILLDYNAKITYWNPAAERIFGYTNEEAVGKKLDTLIIPPKYQGIHSKTTINNYQKGQNHKEIETKALRKNGTEFPIEVSVTTLEIKNKKHLLGIIRDISERQKMETTLREEEKRYHALFDKAPLGILLIDKTGTAVEFNEEAHRQLGYSREEFAKLNVYDYEVIETPEEIKARMEKVLREGKDEFQTKHRTKNGEIRDVVNTVQLIELAGKKFFHLITKDVTEQKKIEGELKIEKAKLETVTENIGAGVGIISKDYHILWVNKLLKQLNGECEGKMCYSTFNKLTEVCPNCGVKKVFESDVPIDIHEYSNLDDEGNRFWIELIVTPIKDEKGNVIAALELAVNITERKIMENKLAEYSQKLEKLVNKRTKQLNLAQAKLVKSERLATIGELAAMVGHDLRNPLTGIMGAAYYLKTKHTPELGAKAKEMLETIENAIIYSNKIVDDLLEYSRDLKLELTEVTPKELLKTALSLTEVPQGIRVVDATEDKPKAKVDAEKLRRVFVNIIRNAFDAMPEGGILTIKSRKVKGKLEISFKDTGTGMSKETLSKLKGGVPLFTTKAKGMGFGVPICKRIAEAHGGELLVESKVGKGTAVTITVPVKPKPVDPVKDIWIFNESMMGTVNAKQKTK